MFLSGFHGTSRDSARQIVNGRWFKSSAGKREWLGSGVYFYKDVKAAYDWCGADPKNPTPSEAIVHAVVSVDEDRYLDLDTEENLELFDKVQKKLRKKDESRFYFSDTKRIDAQLLQCEAVMAIRDAYPRIQVVAASLYAERKPPTIIDPRKRRTEFCIVDAGIDPSVPTPHIRTLRVLYRSQLDGSEKDTVDLLP